MRTGEHLGTVGTGGVAGHGRVRRLATVVALVVVLLAALVGPTTPARADTEYGGTLADGSTTWRAVVPDDWNGTLLLYAHGYQPSIVPPAPAPIGSDPATVDALLARGYALAGSSYVSTGWVVGAATDNQVDALDAAVTAIGRQPDRVLAWGSSMGGLVTGRLAEQAGDVIDGAMPTCGLMGGAVDLNNYQLDGAHAIDQLLALDRDIPLVGYDTPGEAFATAGAMTAAVDAALQTEQGRARVALVSALFHMPDWRPGAEEPGRFDIEARRSGQAAWLSQTLGFVLLGRHDIEAAAGGNASWNTGVDYRRLFTRSSERGLVRHLYRHAGLDLRADLDQLTATADVDADPEALASLTGSSTLTGDLEMPVFSLHTTDDNLAPDQYQDEYAEDVRSTGNRRLLRQAFVGRQGHCAFTTAELVTGLQVLEHRVRTGRWLPTNPWSLGHRADRLGLGEAAYVWHHPGELLTHDQPSRPGPWWR